MPVLTPKKTMAIAKQSILRGYMSRYNLAIKAARKILDTSLPSELDHVLIFTQKTKQWTL